MAKSKKDLKAKNRSIAKKIRQKKKMNKQTKKPTKKPTNKQLKKTKRISSKSTHIIFNKDGSVDLPSSILNVYSRGSSNKNHPIPRSIAHHAVSASRLPLTEQQEIIKFLRKESRKFKTPLPTLEPLTIPTSLLNMITSPQHKKIVQQLQQTQGLPVGRNIDAQIKNIELQKKQEAKQAKKWAPVQTTQPLQQIPSGDITSFQVGGREKLEAELQNLKKSSGLNNNFKDKLDKLLGGRSI